MSRYYVWAESDKNPIHSGNSEVDARAALYRFFFDYPNSLGGYIENRILGTMKYIELNPWGYQFMRKRTT